METLIPEGSPLAAYLEGEGEAEPSEDDTSPQHDSAEPPATSFAPHGQPTYTPKTTLYRTYQRIRTGPLSQLRNIYAYAVTSTLGNTDNKRFLEHFRYIIIASQLLSDHTGAASSRADPQGHVPHPRGLSTSLTGVVISAVSAFALVWVLDWAREPRSGSFNADRLSLVTALLAVAATLFYAFLRRQWLKYLRRQAIDAAEDFVESIHSSEVVTSSVITLIQEVELVSRGYRISTPLPPVSRMEGKGRSRKCSRLRAHLSSVYAAAIPAFAAAVEKLRPQVDENDLDRFMEVYDIREEDMLEAFLGVSGGQPEDVGSLKQLRVFQHRASLLRRILLCSLLSIPATGRKQDAVRWRLAVNEMESLSAKLHDLSSKTTKLLDSEEQIPKTLSSLTRRDSTAPTGSPISPFSPSTTASVRRISALSSGIRSLQAKLYLLREDSTRSLSASSSEPDLARLSTSLREQYDSIGADISALMQAWESGRQALAEDISKQERRVSLASAASTSSSTGARISSPSIGGLTAVDEDEHDHTVTASGTNLTLSPRSAALKRLTGGVGGSSDPADSSGVPLPLSPPVTESESDGGGRDDDEVFEAVAAPEPAKGRRSSMTREQRVAKMRKERERLAALREKREASTNMIRELQSVIRLRPAPGPGSGSGGVKGKSKSAGVVAPGSMSGSGSGFVPLSGVTAGSAPVLASSALGSEDKFVDANETVPMQMQGQEWEDAAINDAATSTPTQTYPATNPSTTTSTTTAAPATTVTSV